MKKTEYPAHSFSNVSQRRFAYNTPQVKSSIKSPKNVTELNTETKLFDHIEKEVSSTLTALNNERIKQNTAIDKVKKELKLLSMQATGNIDKSYRTNVHDKDDYAKNKYEAYIKAQENQLRKLEKELVYTKEDLKVAIQANQKLKDQLMHNNHTKDIQSSLLHIIAGKEEYLNSELSKSKDRGVEELLKGVESIVSNLIKENTELKHKMLGSENRIELNVNTTRYYQSETKSVDHFSKVLNSVENIKTGEDKTPITPDNMKKRIERLNSTLKSIEAKKSTALAKTTMKRTDVGKLLKTQRIDH